MTLAKIKATQQLYQSLTGTKHVHLKGRRVPAAFALRRVRARAHAPAPAPAPRLRGCRRRRTAGVDPAVRRSRRDDAAARRGVRHTAGSARVKNPSARCARAALTPRPPRSYDMITSVAIPCALVSVGGVYLVRAPAAACAPLPSGSRVSRSFF